MNTPLIDPITSLAYAIEAGPGVYALLLGSGISSAAEVPTGWQVVQDLVRKLAAAQGVEPGPDEVTWYREAFGADPEFSKLLKALGRTPADRANILKTYFEPTDEEKERGAKAPTAAHRAIARLVAGGYVRVILTTNFDRLMERALEDEGVAPIVISTPAAAAGAPPLTQSTCVLVKLNGDYLDSRIKVTDEDLAAYDPRIRQILFQVLKEYGLVVCGWSTDHDAGLRAAVQANPVRRYGIYWTYRHTLAPETKRLTDLLRAEVIPVESADTFFTDVERAVTSLATFRRPHPLSTAMAVQSLKRYLTEPRYRIELDDLLWAEIDKLAALVAAENFPVVSGSSLAADDFGARLARYEAAAGAAVQLFATAGWYAEARTWPSLRGALERLLNRPIADTGVVVWVAMQRYPELLCLYAAGVAATATQHYGLLAELLQAPVMSAHAVLHVYEVLRPWAVLDGGFVQKVVKQRRQQQNDFHTPISEYLFDVMREPLRQLLPSDQSYSLAFDRFEYLGSLLTAQYGKTEYGLGRSHAGRWAYMIRNTNGPQRYQNPAAFFGDELDKQDLAWEPIQQGLFGGSTLGEIETLKTQFDKDALQLGWF